MLLPLDEEEPVGEEFGNDEEEKVGEEVAEGQEANVSQKRACLAEYVEKWSALLAQHSKAVPGLFSRDNLVPQPDHRLWQDCPHVPFSLLKSDAAQARLSVCQPISGLQEQNVIGGVPTYAHNTGEVEFVSLATSLNLSPMSNNLIFASWINFVFLFDVVHDLKQ